MLLAANRDSTAPLQGGHRGQHRKGVGKGVGGMFKGGPDLSNRPSPEPRNPGETYHVLPPLQKRCLLNRMPINSTVNKYKRLASSPGRQRGAAEGGAPISSGAAGKCLRSPPQLSRRHQARGSPAQQHLSRAQPTPRPHLSLCALPRSR